MATEELKNDQEENDFREEMAQKLWSSGEGADVETVAAGRDDTPELEPKNDKPVADSQTQGAGDDELNDDQAGEVPALGDLTQALNALRETVGGLDYRMKQTESRVGSIQNSIRDQVAAAKEASERVGDSPSKQEIADASGSKEKWAELKEEYVEWADVMDAIEERFEIRGESKTKLEQERDRLNTDFTKALNRQQLETEIKFVSLAHKDWRQIDDSQEFKDWLKNAPEDIQQRSGSSNSEDIIYVLDQYKGSLEPTGEKENSGEKDPARIKQERRARLERSQEIKKGTKTPKPKSVEDMTEEELRAHFAANWDDL
jgi:hypothetical protein